MGGFGDGNLGSGCNDTYSEQCDTVFRARATTFVSLTWFALFLAWEMVDMRRSFFRMQPGSKRYFTQWMVDVWRNQFLFWAIVFVEALLFFLGAEAWKWAKRVYFRRRAAKLGQRPQDLEKRAFGSFIEISDEATSGSGSGSEHGEKTTTREKR